MLIERPLAVFSRFQPQKAGGGFFFGATLGARLRAVRRALSSRRSRADAASEHYGLRVHLADRGVRGRRRRADARDRLRRPRGVRSAPRARPDGPPRLRAADRPRRARARLPPRRQPRQVHAGLHQRSCRRRSRAARRRSASSRRSAAARPRSRSSAPRQSRHDRGLPDYGVAPPIHADGAWINSPPLNLAALHGKVVLIDFWTYSCINCLRTLPHLKAWYAAYHKDGLVIIGVHTPEFAFEHVTSNVQAAVKRLGITYPVVQDNDYKTWDNYANQYWPAEYLIDKTGHVRHTEFGEGSYPETEQLIRTLLGVQGAGREAAPRHDADRVDDARDLSRPRPDRELRRLDPRAEQAGDLHLSGRRRSPRTCSPTADAGTSARSRSSPARARRSACTSTRRTCTSCSAARARCTHLDRRQADRDAERGLLPALHRPRVERRPTTACSSCASRPACRRTRSRSASAHDSDEPLGPGPPSFSRSKR